MNIKAFWKLTYGLYIVSSWDGDRPTGCTANSVMQITAEPPTIAVSIHHDNFTNQCINKTGRFAVSVLGQNIKPIIIGTFGFKSGSTTNKFESVDYSILDGMPILNDACAYFVCELINKMETDTHTVFLGRVNNADVLHDDPVMTYAYYQTVIKGRSSKNAPTYQNIEKK